MQPAYKYQLNNYLIVLCVFILLAYQVILKLVAGAQEYEPEGHISIATWLKGQSSRVISSNLKLEGYTQI